MNLTRRSILAAAASSVLFPYGAWGSSVPYVTPEDYTGGGDIVQGWLQLAHDRRVKAVAAGKTYVTPGFSMQIRNALDVELVAGAEIIGASGSDQAVMLFDGGTALPRVAWRQIGVIDSSRRTYIPNRASGTGIVLKRIRDYSFDGLVFRGRPGFGDSGVAAEECVNGSFRDCVFLDHPDVGVYLTGSNKAVGGEAAFDNCKFIRCAHGVTARRGYDRVRLDKCLFDECLIGYQAAEANGIRPGDKSILTACQFSNIGLRAVDMRGQHGAVLLGNDVDGYARSGAGWPAFMFLGCSGVLVADNRIRNPNVIPNGRGLYFADYELNGEWFASEDNRVNDNTLINIHDGIFNRGSGPLYEYDNTFVNVVRPRVGPMTDSLPGN